MTAASNASSSAYEVSMRHATSGKAERTSRQTSIPLPSGRRTSRMATWGRVGGIRSRASAAVAASPTTSKSSSASSNDRSPVRTISWSSRRNTLMV